MSLAVNLCLGTKFSIRFYNFTILPLSKIYYILSIVFCVLLSLVYNSLYYYFNDSLFLVSSSISRALLSISSFNPFIISSTYFSLSFNYFFNLLDSNYIPFFSISYSFTFFYYSFLSASFFSIFSLAFAMFYFNFSISLVSLFI